MFVAGVPFFVTYSRKIKFTMGDFLARRTARQLANFLKKVLFFYARGGFVVRLCMMDREFEPVIQSPWWKINTKAAREHVGLIKRRIRVIKERNKSFRKPVCVCKYTRYGADTLCIQHDILAEYVSEHVRKTVVFPTINHYGTDC